MGHPDWDRARPPLCVDAGMWTGFVRSTPATDAGNVPGVRRNLTRNSCCPANPRKDLRPMPLRSQAVILPNVAADLASGDQPVCYLLFHVPKADLFALQPAGKPVKGC